MAFNVRIFSVSGLVQAQLQSVKQLGADSVFMLKLPYLVGEKLTSNGATPVTSSTATAPAGTKFLWVQVDDGNTIRFEVNGNGVISRAVTTNSPRLSGETQIDFSQGASFSFADAASL